MVLLSLALALGWVAVPAGAQTAPKEPVDYVDPMIGTLFGGFSFPGAAAPFGMVQLSPDTEGEFAYTGYQYGDTSIRGFSHHHIQSMGVHSNADLPFMPTVGPVQSTDPRSWMSPFDHGSEEATAGYYRVLLERYGILAELTAGTRVGMHRYTFPPSPQANVILDVGHSASDWHPYAPGAHQGSLEIVGHSTVVGSAPTQGYTIHFAAKFDRPFSAVGAWDSGATPTAGKRVASGNGAGGYVTFDTLGDRDVLVKVGISFVSRDNALQNLETEKPDWDFDALHASTRAAWNDALKTITVEGNDLDKASFYTALYHAQHHPNVYEDVNGQYMGHDDQVHDSDAYTHYANFSLWDTYRGENQLLATIQPDRYRDMMTSLLKIYEEAGRFPQWAMNDALPDYMEGDPIQPTIVDGYCRGLVDDEQVDEMYAALRSQAWDETMADGIGKRSATQGGARTTGDGVYRDYHYRGYMSGRGANGSANFEYAIADFSLALMADSLGKDADRDELLSRADNYRELINPSTGFAHPRNADGTFMADYMPEAPDYWKEGTGWQYTWLAPQDLRGLFDLVGAGRGGDQHVRERLDTYFSTAAADAPAVAEAQKTMTAFGVAYVGNQHAPSNEHDVHAPYLYDYIGEPWKTQKIMRGYQMLFRPTPDGLPGNDDLGSMSAWYVWSALGFYPVQGGAPVYSVGSPLFTRAEIGPVGSDDSVVVTAPGASVANKYIQSATLGGAALDRPWFTHDELFGAANVSFVMGPAANTSWGSAPQAAPPSISTDPSLDSFGCPARTRSEPVASTLVYTGDTRGRGDRVTLAARLTSEAGEPLAGRSVTFEIAGQTLMGTTDDAGLVSVAATVPDHGKSQVVIVRFAGDADHLPNETSARIVWGGSKNPTT
jgi:predicted alpha-1,2-mannosidase